MEYTRTQEIEEAEKWKIRLLDSGQVCLRQF
jgi:hypothetical protein